MFCTDHRHLLAALAASLLIWQGLAHADPERGAQAPAHHRGSQFQNNHLEFEPKIMDLLRWRWQAARMSLPRPPARPTPTVAPDLPFLRSNAVAGAAMQPAVTWVGHASVLVQMAGLNLLTDPIFSERASPVAWAGPQRAQPPGLSLADLPHIDLVLISHNHYDHCDEASLRALNRQTGAPPLFVVPLGMKLWMADIGVTNVVELDWWQSHQVGAAEVVLTPAQHWSGRGLTDRMHALWGSYAVFAPDLHMFFAGDTGYSKDFSAIAERFADRHGAGGFDIALIPVGAYEPRWFMAQQHVDPSEAVRMHLDLRAKRSLAIHWGTFELSDEALDQPPLDLAVARRNLGVGEADFFTLAIGQTHKLPRRSGAQ